MLKKRNKPYTSTSESIRYLQKNIELGLQLDHSQSRIAEIECGSTNLGQDASGWCQFFYCWDDANSDYYSITAVCSTDDGVIRQKL